MCLVFLPFPSFHTRLLWDPSPCLLLYPEQGSQTTVLWNFSQFNHALIHLSDSFLESFFKRLYLQVIYFFVKLLLLLDQEQCLPLYTTFYLELKVLYLMLLSLAPGQTFLELFWFFRFSFDSVLMFPSIVPQLDGKGKEEFR